MKFFNLLAALLLISHSHAAVVTLTYEGNITLGSTNYDVLGVLTYQSDTPISGDRYTPQSFIVSIDGVTASPDGTSFMRYANDYANGTRYRDFIETIGGYSSGSFQTPNLSITQAGFSLLDYEDQPQFPIALSSQNLITSQPGFDAFPSGYTAGGDDGRRIFVRTDEFGFSTGTLDKVTVTVPEPSAALLLGLGSLTIIGLRRKNRNFF